MTRYLISLFSMTTIISNCAIGQDTHKVGLFSTVNTKQQHSVGFGGKYQWQFHPSFALESQLLTTGDIKTQTNDTSYIGDQTLLSIGAVFLKNYNPDLLITFASGVNYVVTSSHQSFIKQSSISPYIKFSLEYQLTNQSSLEVGQLSYFQDDLIGNNFNFFISFNYVLSYKRHVHNTQNFIKKSVPTTMVPANKTEIKPQSNATTPTKPKRLNKPLYWVVQLGAYSNEINANRVLYDYQSTHSLMPYKVVFFDGFFRIISSPFKSESAAKRQSQVISLSHGITNLVKEIN